MAVGMDCNETSSPDFRLTGQVRGEEELKKSLNPTGEVGSPSGGIAPLVKPGVLDCLLVAAPEAGAPRLHRYDLGKDSIHDLAAHVREPEVTAHVTVGEPLVIQSKQVENRRVQVGEMDRVVRDLDSVFV